jgi:hypothetical protein
MKVRELMSKLSAFDAEHEVLCYCEDEELLPNGHGFRLLEINSIKVTQAEKTRGNDQIPSLKLEKTPKSMPYVLIDVTADF